MKTSDIGLIGLAVMGENLALNMESKGYTVSVYNRNSLKGNSAVDRFMQGRGKNKNFIGTYSIAELVESVKKPRKIMMMVKAGEPVDDLIHQLEPYLSPGDVIIDGGNSDFNDTARRVEQVEAKGFYFIGTGVSGGEEGALLGPSIMPGGSYAAWPLVKELLQRIAAHLPDGTPCCEWIGSGGAGHFVKMVHNGIEYGDMQLITEAYSLLKRREHLTNDELHLVFDAWNKDELNSFLIEITSHIVNFKEPDGSYLLDNILDVAGQKGTGKWSVIAALNEGDPLTLITASVYARLISSLKDERLKASSFFQDAPVMGYGPGTDAIKEALYAAKLISYAQGFSLMYRASAHFGWGLDLASIARIWREGCIIRSSFLGKITEAYQNEPLLENLLFDRFFRSRIEQSLAAWRTVVADGVLCGIALPCMGSGLAYFDGLRTFHSAANLLQAQRDYFGAHTFERTDAARGTFFHANWTGKGGKTISGSYNV